MYAIYYSTVYNHCLVLAKSKKKELEGKNLYVIVGKNGTLIWIGIIDMGIMVQLSYYLYSLLNVVKKMFPVSECSVLVNAQWVELNWDSGHWSEANSGTK